MSDVTPVTNHHRRRALLSKAFEFVCLAATSLSVLVLVLFVLGMWLVGMSVTHGDSSAVRSATAW